MTEKFFNMLRKEKRFIIIVVVLQLLFSIIGQNFTWMEFLSDILYAICMAAVFYIGYDSKKTRFCCILLALGWLVAPCFVSVPWRVYAIADCFYIIIAEVAFLLISWIVKNVTKNNE